MGAELRETAEVVARRAGELLLERFSSARTVQLKTEGRQNLVTDADRAAEQLIVETLRERYPSHGLLAEEGGALSSGELRWFIDPLDGTTNYARGIPHFAVSLAVEGPGPEGTRQLLAGVVFDPIRDELFSAARDDGATLNGRTLVMREGPALEQAVLATGFPYDLALRPERPLAVFNQLVVRVAGIRRMGSAALDLAWLAAGRFDAFVECGLKPWDTAAGALLITEAGGQIQSLDGSVYSPLNGDVVASGTGLHRRLTEALVSIDRGPGSG